MKYRQAIIDFLFVFERKQDTQQLSDKLEINGGKKNKIDEKTIQKTAIELKEKKKIGT